VLETANEGFFFRESGVERQSATRKNEVINMSFVEGFFGACFIGGAACIIAVVVAVVAVFVIAIV